MKSWIYARSLTKNKSLEIQISPDFPTDFAFDLRFTTREDHAGLYGSLQVGPFYFGAGIRDNRHWDYEGGTYE